MPEDIDSYKELCESIEYNELNRNPKDYENNDIYIEGTVADIYEDEDSVEAYIDVHNNSENKMLIVFSPDIPEQRILEGDNITAWGSFKGVFSSGSTPDGNSIIGMEAYSVVINEDSFIQAKIEDNFIVISEEQFRTNYNLEASFNSFELISDFEFLESDKDIDNIFYQYYFENGTKLLLCGYRNQVGFENILIETNNVDTSIDLDDNFAMQEFINVLCTVTRSIFSDVSLDDLKGIVSPLTETFYDRDVITYKYNGLNYNYLAIDNSLYLYIEVDKN